MYDYNTSDSGIISSLKNNLNKITAIISFCFIISSIIEIYNCFYYANIDLTGFSVIYLCISSFIIIFISIITIYVSLKGKYHFVSKKLALITTILLILSVIIYFVIYNSEFNKAKEIYNDSRTDFLSLINDEESTPKELRADRLVHLGSFPPFPSFSLYSGLIYFPTELTEEKGYYLGFLYIAFYFLFFAQLYFRHFDDKENLDKIEILNKEEK